MESVLDRLQEHEERTRALVERLREGAERVAGQLAAADDSLARLVIARQRALEMLEAEPDQGTGVGESRGAAGRGTGRNQALYERITRVFAGAGGALRPRQVCEALGMPPEARFIEAMRPKRVGRVLGQRCDAVVLPEGEGPFPAVVLSGGLGGVAAQSYPSRT